MSRSQENKNEKTNEGDEAIRRHIEERRNIVKGDKHQLKDLSKKIKKCIRDRKKKTKNNDKKRYSGFWRDSEASKVDHA